MCPVCAKAKCRRARGTYCMRSPYEGALQLSQKPFWHYFPWKNFLFYMFTPHNILRLDLWCLSLVLLCIVCLFVYCFLCLLLCISCFLCLFCTEAPIVLFWSLGLWSKTKAICRSKHLKCYGNMTLSEKVSPYFHKTPSGIKNLINTEDFCSKIHGFEGKNLHLSKIICFVVWHTLSFWLLNTALASHGTSSMMLLFHTATCEHKPRVFSKCVPIQAVPNQGDVLNMATMVATITIFLLLLQYAKPTKWKSPSFLGNLLVCKR